MSIISILELAGVAHLPRSQQLIESLILVEGYKEAQVEFGSVAGEEQAKSTIDQFRDLVNRNQVQGNERNIDYWRKQGWDQFSAFVREKSQEKSKRQQEREQGRAIILKETPDWLIVIPLDKDASCFHGRNTDWCTTKRDQGYFEEYFYDNNIVLIYFLQLDTGNKWAIACHTDTDEIEMFDIRDSKINAAQFKAQTGFDPMEFRDIALNRPEYREQYKQAKQEYNTLVEFVRQQRPFTKVDPKLEQALTKIKDFNVMLEYCTSVKGEWNVLAKMAKRNPRMASQYAIHVMNRRWPEAEPFILQDLHISQRYSKHFDMHPDDWLEHAEGQIKDPKVAVTLAVILGFRIPEFEPLILTDPKAIADYSYYVLKKLKMMRRWREGEQALMQMIQSDNNASYALMCAVEYATDTRDSRWEDLEQVMLDIRDSLGDPDEDYNFSVAWENYSDVFPGWENDEEDEDYGGDAGYAY